MSEKIIAYNFLARKFGWDLASDENFFDTISDFKIPHKVVSMYDIDTLKRLNAVYVSAFGTYLVKVNGKDVLEFYTTNSKHYTKENASYIALDFFDMPKEYYLTDKTTLKKYSYETDELLQTNYLIRDFSELPQSAQVKLENFDRKDAICLYAQKEYGEIVEVREQTFRATK